MRIFYAGAPLSGRKTTLKSLSGPFTPPLTDVQVRCEDTGALWRESLVRSPIDGTVDAQGLFVRAAEVVVFVVDSQVSRLESNVAHLARLRSGLEDVDRHPDTLPIVFQCNKRDLRVLSSMAELREALVWPRCEFVESIASKGVGTVEAIRAAIALASAPKA